ncbi:WD40 repeat domain-containing protein [Micromonospora chersina]|uniref:WD40 repeat domain-containing protein n=1 Tax=Micromonospora chersina TaxID=47854 RepID=UPI0037124343
MPTDEVLLTHPDPSAPRHLHLAVDGARLLRRSWRGNAKERHSSRDLPNPQAARDALAREAAARMREGFVFVRGSAGTPPGEPVLRCAPPNSGGDQTFDLHPQGHTLAVASLHRGAYGADLHLIDVTTGQRRLVHTETPGSGPARQTFIHTVLFDADGTGLVYALNGETRHLDLTTGATRILAAYEQFSTARFNPFCARPAQDATRQRLLLFDADDRVRVRTTSTADDVLVLHVADQPECRAGALSPSGRLLALTYGVHDAIVQLWHVDTGRLLHSTRFPFPFANTTGRTGIRHLGFDPTERLVLATGGFAEGPFALPIEGDTLAWAVADPYRTDRYGTCFSWQYSPGGDLLAIGGRLGATLHLPTGEPSPVTLAPSHTGRTQRVVFSADGTLLACGGDTGQLSVHYLTSQTLMRLDRR